jgi:hypothetical protein
LPRGSRDGLCHNYFLALTREATIYMIRLVSQLRFAVLFRAAAICAGVSLLCSPFAQAQPSSITFEDVGFEALLGAANPWRPFQHAGVKAYEFARDKEVKTEGAQSLRITQREPQVYGAVRQSIARPAAGRYELSAKMRSRGTDGRGWRMEVAIIMPNGETPTEETKALLGDVDWTRRELRFTVPPNALFVEIIIGLHGNTGTGWIDELQLKPVP